MTSSQPLSIHDEYGQRMTSLQFPVDDAYVQSSVPLVFPAEQDVLYCGRDGGSHHVVVLVPMSVTSSGSAHRADVERHQSSAGTQLQHGVDLTVSAARTTWSSGGEAQDLTTQSTRCSDPDRLCRVMSTGCQRLSLIGNKNSEQDVTDWSVVKSSTSPELTTRNPMFGKYKSPKSYWLRRHSDSVFATQSAPDDDVAARFASDSEPQLYRTCSDSRATLDHLDMVARPTIYESHQLATLPDRLLSTVVGVHYSADADDVFDESSDDSTLQSEPTSGQWTSQLQPSCGPGRSRLTVVSTGDLEDIREEELGTCLDELQRGLHVGFDVVDSSSSVKIEVSEQLVPGSTSTADRQSWHCATVDGVTCRRDADTRMLGRPETACSPTATIHRRAPRVVRSARSATSDESTSGLVATTSGACRLHRCTVCRRTFSRSDMLERHARLHSGLRPYACRLCPQVFSRSDHLTTHLRTHTGEKPYSCPRCSYTASRRDMVTRHLRVHQTTAGADVITPTPTRQRIYRNRYKDRPTKPTSAVHRQSAVDVVALPSSPPQLPQPLILSDATRYVQSVDERRVQTTLPAPLSPAAVEPPAVYPRCRQPVHALPRPVVARGSTGSTDSYSSPGCLNACDIFEFAVNSVGAVEGSPDVFRSPLSGRHQSTVFLFPCTATDTSSGQASSAV